MPDPAQSSSITMGKVVCPMVCSKPPLPLQG
eukprot:CAMPEP_0180807646 /NCGR_PEP_ID=MMETSP1038_2-20121128/63362_1 /TAXON_ID=632150 /ORGANISM="Azadinium spinosum, Strain 3D9" /LENGTH=30 /DNA_ID= /DNA_START= /DNA_END= /DNA_ORIENTATION=